MIETIDSVSKIILSIIAVAFVGVWVLVPFVIIKINKRLERLNKNVSKIGKILSQESESTKQLD